MQRTPIKLNIISLSERGQRELLGYIVLDLRYPGLGEFVISTDELKYFFGDYLAFRDKFVSMAKSN